jgi:signal transduction histidine kinase
MLEILQKIEKIRKPWMTRVAHSLARGVGVRENFQNEVDHFFNLLVQTVETGTPEWLDPLLQEWATSLTQTDLEDKHVHLPALLNEFLSNTYEVARETLDNGEAMEVLGALIPCYTYALSRAVDIEMDQRIEYISHQLEQTQQALERLDRSKSDFISVAAHELKTPLTLVEGYNAMVKETINNNPSPEQINLLLDGIDHGSQRLRQIIDDMIDVSLIDNQLLKLNLQPFWLNRLLHTLAAELETPIKNRRLKFNIIDFPGSNEICFGDPERLTQVFRNVLLNAIKYTPDGGEITIDGRKLPGFIETTIADSGIGIDPEDQLIIFEKFSQVGDSSLHSSGKTKFKGGGPGLGLHIAKGIITAHGGTIWVESKGCDEKKCPGSTFHILLPIENESPDDKIKKLFNQMREMPTQHNINNY